MHTTQLEIPISIGLDGVDTNSINCVSRAFSSLLGNGKPHKAHVFCFLNYLDTNIESITQRWLEVFVHTEGDRVLFFPGLDKQLDWIEVTKEESPTNRETFYLDHFSAEPRREEWHLTTTTSAKHLRGGRLRKSGDESYFWFSLSLQSHHAFPPIYKRTILTYETPRSDTARRLKLLRKLEQPHYEVRIENVESKMIHPYFLHLCFILIPPTAPNYSGSEFILPNGSPYLLTPLPDSIENLQFWRNRVRLSTQWDIQIITMLLPGALSIPFTFTSFE